MNSFAKVKLFLLKGFDMGGSLQLSLALLAGAACLFLAAAAFSQGIATGSMSGTVTDATGAIVPGAIVTAVNMAPNQTFAEQTNDAGIVAQRPLPQDHDKVGSKKKNYPMHELQNV